MNSKKNYTKSYIGKGTQVVGMDIVKINLRVEDLLKLTHKWEGVEYLSFELAKMQSEDKFGRTHTAYVQVADAKTEEPVIDKEAQKAAKKAARKAAEKEARTAAKAAKTENEVPEMCDAEIPF